MHVRLFCTLMETFCISFVYALHGILCKCGKCEKMRWKYRGKCEKWCKNIGESVKNVAEIYRKV